MAVSTGKELSNLGTREAFNQTLRHIVNVTNLVEAVTRGGNLADLLNDLLENNVIQREQVPPMLSVILINKLNLPYRSINLNASLGDEALEKIAGQCKKWNGIDLVVVYYHPTTGVNLVNPAKKEHWDALHGVKVNELMIVYARAKNNKPETAEKALEAFFAMLDGKTPASDPEFERAAPPPPPPPPPRQQSAPAPQPAARPAAAPQQAAAPRPAQPAAAPAGQKRMTPKYSVQVTNELFHNGNVEAWKNIIESYETRYGPSQVIVYHEGELIQDLNTLFKWGKVKHGGLIFFQVAGVEIKGVSKLQKYLHEGASSRFESFLKHDVNKVLNLF